MCRDFSAVRFDQVWEDFYTYLSFYLFPVVVRIQQQRRARSYHAHKTERIYYYYYYLYHYLERERERERTRTRIVSFKAAVFAYYLSWCLLYTRVKLYLLLRYISIT